MAAARSSSTCSTCCREILKTDTLVFLGDLIDRGADAPGCVEHILKLVARTLKELFVCAETTSRC